MATMKENILNSVDTYFLLDEVYAALPTHTQHSIRGRINELTKSGTITRLRAGTGNKKAIYNKVNQPIAG